MTSGIPKGVPLNEFRTVNNVYPLLSVSFGFGEITGYAHGVGIVFKDEGTVSTFLNDDEVESLRKLSPLQTFVDGQYRAVHVDKNVVEDPLGALEYGPYKESEFAPLNTDLRNLVIRTAARHKIPYATLVFDKVDGFELEVGCNGERNGSIIYGWGDNIITGGWFRKAWNKWRKDNGWASSHDVGLIGNTMRATSDANAFPIDMLNAGMLTAGILYVEEHRPVLMVSSPGDGDPRTPLTNSAIPEGERVEIDEDIQSSVAKLQLPERRAFL